MQQTDDIAAWLTAIWDERQRACVDAQTAIDSHSAMAASGDLELRWMLQLRRGGVFQTGWTMPGPPTPAEDLARIEADRQILALHAGVPGWPDGELHCRECGPDHSRYPCRTIRLLALPHADRPGSREEWRP